MIRDSATATATAPVAASATLPPIVADRPSRAHPVAVATVMSGTEHLALYRWPSQGASATPAAADTPTPTVLLVHGYPDSARVWHDVARRLATRGFQVWAYDVRGAGASSRPVKTHAYRLCHLMDDLLAVIEATGQPRVHLVGHDWGALQGWEAAAEPRVSRRLASFTSVAGFSLDHVGDLLAQRLARARSGSADLSTFRATAGQLLRSWYVWAFHAPLAPLVWGLGLGRAWPRLLARVERAPGIIGLEASPTRALDGAAGVGLYRANVLHRLRHPSPRRIDLPVRAIHATHDPFIAGDLLEGAVPWTPNLSRRDVAAGHWLPLSDPGLLAKLVAEFVGEIEAAEKAAGAASTSLGTGEGRPRRKSRAKATVGA